MKKTIIILASLVIVYILVSSVLTKIIYDQSFPRYQRHDDSINASVRYRDVEEDHPRTLVNFESNGNQLQGYLYPNEEAIGLVVIAHGIGGGADSYMVYTTWFLEQGWAVFNYDATGSFDSEGDTTKGFPQSLIDLENALTYVDGNDTINHLDIVLFGHSWGGYAVVNALHLRDDIKAVVSVAAPSNANDMIVEQASNMMGVFAATQRPFLSAYQSLLFGNYARYDAVDAMNNSAAHVMIIHGVNDTVVRYDGSAMIARRANITNPNVTYVTMEQPGKDGHNNLFRSEEAIRYIDEINVEYRALYDLHDQNIPYAIHQAFYADVDRFRVQELDASLMQQIHEFFENALSNEGT